MKLYNLKVDENGIYYYDTYHPYWVNGEKNKNFDAFSGYILDLKSKKREVHTKRRTLDIINEIVDLENEQVAVICMPSHQQDKWGFFAEIIEGYLHSNKLTDTSRCIGRTYTIPEKALGGIRNLQNEIASCQVLNSHYLEGKDVIIVDDITTSGTTLLAGKYLIENCGVIVSSITCIALGKTG